MNKLCIKLAIIKKLYYDARPNKYQDFPKLSQKSHVNWYLEQFNKKFM